MCGNGMVEGDEECDDGNANDLDGCSSTCVLEARLVFITSTLHDGNLGGVAGADQICNELASDAGLPGTYMAWLSSSQPGENPLRAFRALDDSVCPRSTGRWSPRIGTPSQTTVRSRT